MASGEHGNDVFHHVRDVDYFEVPQFLGGKIHIPQPFGEYFVVTKFMLLEVVALVLAVVIFYGLARRVATGEPVRGRFWNFWEAIVLFLRDQLVRPLIGDDQGHGHGHDAADHHAAQGHGGRGHDHEHHTEAPKITTVHPADRFLPFIWSVFFFILFNNLLGMIPFLGSPTGSIWVTGVLAVSTLAYVIWTGTSALGHIGFWKALVPQMELSGPMKLFILPLLWVIEFVGLLIKHGVLAVRLFANVMAGHTVIAVILGFIAAEAVAGSSLYYLVAPASVLGQVGIGLLELFVAFLQAYVFAFLATLFIGSAVHPH
ncbi:MAG: ATP synthase F0 subunit A [Planctomycetaceae bacterium]|nr:ATP synthase F0 subunit A [Planctomycetaceae bacterium]